MPLDSLLRAFQSKEPGAATSRLRVAVLGAGRMGEFHLRHLSKNPGAVLAGVVDTNASRAKSMAAKYKTPAFARPEDLLGLADAAVIATPTETHYAIGRTLLEASISCLIEKPFASSLEEAERLIRLATEKNCVLQVGHIERFNPAVMEAARHINHPQFIEVNRLGPYDPRVADVGVILDLMIHDLDIVLFLVNEPVTRVEAFGAKVLSRHEDIAKVRLHFAGGCIADLSASRVSLKKYRKIRIFQKNAYLSIDYAEPDLKVYKKKSDVVRGLSDIQILSPKLSKKDPLALELEHFLACVRDKSRPIVAGEHGRDALKLAQEVLEKLKVYD